jgi:ParB family chromosome partitioning protein
MRRALGKGLSQLVAEQFDDTPTEAPVGSIVPNPRQPRLHFNEEALAELAESIKIHGILQPLHVKPSGDGTFELIAGERRLRAAKLAGLKSVPILIRSAGDQGSLELAIIENVQREDINALEAAKAYRRLTDEFGLTQEVVSQKVGKSRTAVANTMRLLRLPKRIQDGLQEGKISEGHARALLTSDSEAVQLALYDQILENGLTVRDVEQKTKKQATGPKPKKAAKGEDKDPNEQALEDALSTFLGTPVRIDRKQVGGEVVIQFYSDDDLERLLEQLGFR